MAYNRAQARRLCTDAEYDVFLASTADQIGALPVKVLAAHIKRSRTLRDKFTDLFRRQTAASRAATGKKRGESGAANERTAAKAKLFAEVLTRFEAQLERVKAREARAEAAAARAAAKQATRRGTRVAGGGAAGALLAGAKVGTPSASASKTPGAQRNRKAAPPRSAKTALPKAQVKGNPISGVVAVRGKVAVANRRASTARTAARRGR